MALHKLLGSIFHDKLGSSMIGSILKGPCAAKGLLSGEGEYKSQVLAGAGAVAEQMMPVSK
jgi:hypothetical protein